MKQGKFAFLGGDRRTPFAAAALSGMGFEVTEDWKEANHVILPLPALDGDSIRGGPPLDEVLRSLRPGVFLYGGQVERFPGAVDYYKDETFTQANADITAEGAVSVLMNNLKCTIAGAEILVLGYGRIGKALARKLMGLGAQVTVAARRESVRQAARSLGMKAVPTHDLGELQKYRALCNTIPAPVVTSEDISRTREDCLLLELASAPGGMVDRGMRTFIRAGGLPARYAPETAGLVLAQTIARLAEGRAL